MYFAWSENNNFWITHMLFHVGIEPMALRSVRISKVTVLTTTLFVHSSALYDYIVLWYLISNISIEIRHIIYKPTALIECW